MSESHFNRLRRVKRELLPTMIRTGKYALVPIRILSTEDLTEACREAARIDCLVQGAIMRELSRRKQVALCRERRDLMKRRKRCLIPIKK